MKIKTHFVYPPIPDRWFDWCAVDDDTYDGEGCSIGYGATEAEAVADLLEQLECNLEEMQHKAESGADWADIAQLEADIIEARTALWVSK